MTCFERTKQILGVFEHAGRIAFGMQIPKGNNPYPKTDANGVAEPSNLAWDRGYQAATDAAYLREHPAKPVVARKPYPFKRPVKPGTGRPANHPRFVGNRGIAPITEVRRAN